MDPTASLLSDGRRLHLHHGPIDLVIGADGQRDRAFDAARARFETVLQELVQELPALKAPLSQGSARPMGRVARRMHDAAIGLCHAGYVTRMAAVAGSVADEVLEAMTGAADLRRAYVNNGGDIALHLCGDATFTTAMIDHRGQALGRIVIRAGDGVCGIATSGRHGRSHSLGIADSVTVLARSAASADVAATLIANAVDLPGHPAIRRSPAWALEEDSDLGGLPVVTGCGPLSEADCQDALGSGLDRAGSFLSQNAICGAALFLQGHAVATSGQMTLLQNRELLHA